MTTDRKRPPYSWPKGTSGNPKGRPPGRSPIAKMREALAGDIPDILAAMVQQAKAGDATAARLILERVLPAMKSIEPTQALNLGDGTLADQGRAVLGAVASGDLAPGQGAALLGAIGQLARVAEIDELAARITALEVQHGNNG